jgi:hypothetical protein
MADNNGIIISAAGCCCNYYLIYEANEITLFLNVAMCDRL